MAALATTEKVLLVILFVSDLVAAQNRLSPCYDSQKRPLRCEPIFSNPAFGLPIEATNTCGELVRTDPYGQFYGPLKLESFRRFYRQTGATGATKDSDYSGHNKTWWQSITLYEYKEREIGDMVQASITLHLGKAFDITYIRLIFHSPRPESFSIWKKTTDTSDWEPYQYYSASCLSTFNVPQDGIIDTPTRAICTREYTHISPLSGGNVAFSTLDNRPNAYEFDRNKLLQEFVTATAIQIRLRRLNTFGDEVFEDTSVLQSYYYAVSEISVGGKCKCNGHANECVQTNSLDGNSRLVCQCQHNTTGPDCNQCLRTHNDKPWAPATILDANVCQGQ
ncbi:LanB2 [Bugula neritina]|uniref:LanB2 n=1 Tax=Bugula neritina TaxID=10212 RepID=A0A7J7J6W6_BUGNE|nr:LanB2 [Bugula neritina]